MILMFLSSVAIVSLLVIFVARPPHFVHVGGLRSTIYWTVRSWLWAYPVTSEYPGLWYAGNPSNNDEYVPNVIRVVRLWGFLRPFFRSHGYELFVTDPNDVFGPLRPPTPSSFQSPTFPYAQRFYREDAEAAFVFTAPRVWPARDSQGRDVVIKAVSGSTPPLHAELLALRRLNSNPLRDDPHNHTIPLLDLLQFDGQVFAVMPRWGSARHGDFTTIDQMLRYGLAFLEALAFLHSNNITHGDISLQNMLIDAVLPRATHLHPFPDSRGPERRYVFIDFETARFSPEPGAYQKDMHQLAAVLERTLMCAADEIPALVPLILAMKASSISALEAFGQLETIFASVPDSTLRLQTDKVLYFQGTFRYRQANGDLSTDQHMHAP